MSHIDVYYASREAVLDSAGLLDRLRLITGDELAAGWRTAASARTSPEAWLVTLEHDTDVSLAAMNERLLAAADPYLRVCTDAEPERPPSVFGIESLVLPLPVDVPRALLGSEGKQRERAATYGMLLGLIISAVLGILPPRGNVLRHMFDPRTPTAAVPVAILCLFFWGVIYGLNRRRRLRAIESLNGEDLLPAVVDGLQKHGVARLEEALRGQVDQYSVVRYSPLLRRIRVTLEQWLIRPSLQHAHLAIEQQVISDREATQRAYNLLRIFVWATPVLGLIGTVVGISIAVGGFAGFLSTNVEDISKIKAGLVGVTGGLSFAFLITLEGLLSSLILMLFTSNIQMREERLYAAIERDIVEVFLPALQRVSPEKDSAGLSLGTDAWADAMAEVAIKVIRAIEIAGKRILAKWDETHKVYVADLKDSGTAVSDLALVAKQMLESQVELRAAIAQLRDSSRN